MDNVGRTMQEQRIAECRETQMGYITVYATPKMIKKQVIW
jgi:hypothetical protein